MSSAPSFKTLELIQPVQSALTELGYETPTPVQAQSIPMLMAGHDLSAQAQTGTGKTAAFALPILSQLELDVKKPQALIITPTRELAIQVAEAFQSYAKHLKGFHVAPIYGGQDYQIQLRALKRGTHVIVGTPGRIMDHLRRGTLSVDHLKTLVLDEGDEMLKMGFIDDIEWILSQISQPHQTALFSATMPERIQRIAKRYLKEPKKINIKPTKRTVDTIEQCYTYVSGKQKLDLLTRFLEVEDIQAAIIFVRTKHSSSELGEKLQARGYAAAALNGDMSQSQREKVIARIKKGTLDIIVATDVAARGIDVERISHVINFDIPCDTESYIHRIGRTGRAGRQGKALLFVAPREQHLFNAIERVMQQSIKQVEPPSIKQMRDIRSNQLSEKITGIIERCKTLSTYQDMIDNIMAQADHTPKDIAAALLYLSQQSSPLPSHEIQTARPQQRDNERRQAPYNRRKSSKSFRKKSTSFAETPKKGPKKSTGKPTHKRKPGKKKRPQSS